MSLVDETKEATAQPQNEDRFKFDLCNFNLHFPCVVCIHRAKPIGDACTGCRFYFN